MTPQPAIFFGHGNPLNAILDTPYSRAWAAMGSDQPRPTAILAISAHWYINETAVTAMATPRTIHDFGGFPPELYAVNYPAPGSPPLAARVAALLQPLAVRLDHDWGLDHGTWSVLTHLFPAADIPVVQLSIDRRQPAAFHYETGRRLGLLRDEGVMIIGSGDIVHNLGTYRWGAPDSPPYDWARRFEEQAREAIGRREHQRLVEWEGLGSGAQLAVPTPEHYLPLLHVLGASRETDQLDYPVEGIEGGSISMLSIRYR